jgi:hypothetical protein
MLAIATVGVGWDTFNAAWSAPNPHGANDTQPTVASKAPTSVQSSHEIRTVQDLPLLSNLIASLGRDSLDPGEEPQPPTSVDVLGAQVQEGSEGRVLVVVTTSADRNPAQTPFVQPSRARPEIASVEGSSTEDGGLISEVRGSDAQGANVAPANPPTPVPGSGAESSRPTPAFPPTPPTTATNTTQSESGQEGPSSPTGLGPNSGPAPLAIPVSAPGLSSSQPVPASQGTASPLSTGAPVSTSVSRPASATPNTTVPKTATPTATSVAPPTPSTTPTPRGHRPPKP